MIIPIRRSLGVCEPSVAFVIIRSPSAGCYSCGKLIGNKSGPQVFELHLAPQWFNMVQLTVTAAWWAGGRSICNFYSGSQKSKRSKTGMTPRTDRGQSQPRRKRPFRDVDMFSFASSAHDRSWMSLASTGVQPSSTVF